MKVIAFVVMVLALAASAAQARSTTAQGLRAQLVMPVQFASSDGCSGAALYGVVTGTGRGSGVTCFLSSADFSACDQGVGLCRDLATRTTLRLPGGTLTFEASQREIILPSPADVFSLEIVWTGKVTSASGGYRSLIGSRVSGGGHTSFDASGNQTGDLAFSLGG